MFRPVEYDGSRTKDYELLLNQLESLNQDEYDPIAVLSNASALLDQFLDDVNWTGFYLYKNEELVLGPFQGLPACIRIPFGEGVCGTALKERKTIRVEDVRSFPGHIACDAASLSEIVVPLLINGNMYGVLDIDSPITDRFDATDQHYIERYAQLLTEHLAASPSIQSNTVGQEE